VTARPGAAPDTTSRRGLVVGLVLGVPLVAYGGRGALVDGARTHPAELARWVVGAAIVNDLVLIPLVLAVGWAAHRFTPARLWPAIRAGLVTTAVLTLVAWPFVRGYGRDPANPSLLSRDYGTGLAVAIGVVWAAVAIWALAATLRERARRSARSRPPGAPGAPPRAPEPSGPPLSAPRPAGGRSARRAGRARGGRPK
jgi:hypothetical protein